MAHVVNIGISASVKSYKLRLSRALDGWEGRSSEKSSPEMSRGDQRGTWRPGLSEDTALWSAACQLILGGALKGQ